MKKISSIIENKINNFNINLRNKQLEILNIKNEKYKFYETLFSVGEVVLVDKSAINEIHINKKSKNLGLYRSVYSEEKKEKMVIMEIDTRNLGSETISLGQYCEETNTFKGRFRLKGYMPSYILEGDYFKFIKKTNKKVEMPKDFKMDFGTISIFDDHIYKII